MTPGGAVPAAYPGEHVRARPLRPADDESSGTCCATTAPPTWSPRPPTAWSRPCCRSSTYEPAAEGDRGRLLGHVARNNDQWRLPALGEALVIVRGPDAYVSPSWYATKAEHGRVVPTWNYVTAHVHGRLVVHDDPAWVEDLVRRLTDRARGPAGTQPWSVDDAPPATSPASCARSSASRWRSPGSRRSASSARTGRPRTWPAWSPAWSRAATRWRTRSPPPCRARPTTDRDRGLRLSGFDAGGACWWAAPAQAAPRRRTR